MVSFLIDGCGRRYICELIFLHKNRIASKLISIASVTLIVNILGHLAIGQVMTHWSLDRNIEPVESDTMLLSTARHRCDISLKRAVLPVRNDAEIDPSYLHISA